MKKSNKKNDKPIINHIIDEETGEKIIQVINPRFAREEPQIEEDFDEEDDDEEQSISTETIREFYESIQETDEDENENRPRIRDILEKLKENKRQLYDHPIYKEAHEDGFWEGVQETKEHSRMVIRGLFEIFEDTKPPNMR